jgi:hypothetical protein
MLHKQPEPLGLPEASILEKNHLCNQDRSSLPQEGIGERPIDPLHHAPFLPQFP